MSNSITTSASAASLDLLQDATGKIPYSLTNDYMFRATFQSNNNALKGLICSLTNMTAEQVTSVEVMNPIELGKHMKAKDFVLDIRVKLNNNSYINIEMQLLNLGNWPERSLGYLCRSFDSLNKGQDYIEAKPVIQVCFLDFTLFKDYPEFFSTYLFMNAKNHIIYSDKLKLYVIDLTCIDIATAADQRCGIDYWARLFKAETWEEIKMLASQNTGLTEAAVTLHQLSEEEKIRLQCEAREDYYRQQRYIQHKLKEAEAAEQKLQQYEQEMRQYEQEMQQYELKQQQYEQEKTKLLSGITEKDDEIARLKAELAKYKAK